MVAGLRVVAVAALAVCGAFGQEFEVAAVKASQFTIGHDRTITTDAGRFIARMRL